jgi:hypothetical protein
MPGRRKTEKLETRNPKFETISNERKNYKGLKELVADFDSGTLGVLAR